MKKILSYFLFIFISNIGYSQTLYPINQNLGRSASTLVSTNSLRADQGLILGSFPDTASANLLPYLKNYNAAQIFVSGDTSIYLRFNNKWYRVASGSGGGSGVTIYTGDGTITSNRTMNLSTFLFNIDRGSDKALELHTSYSKLFSPNNTRILSIWNDSITLGTTTSFIKLYNGFVGFDTYIPTSKIHVTTDNIAVSQTDATGILLQNSTAATSGVRRQLSPSLVFSGTAWKSSATAASQVALWRVENRPETGPSISSTLQFQSNLNAVGYNNVMTLGSGGGLQLLDITGNFGTVNSVPIGVYAGVVYYGQRPSQSTGSIGNVNVSVGSSALSALTSGLYNTAVGVSSMQFDTSGSINTAVGYSSLRANTNGYSNTAIGANSGLVNTTGFQNTFLGAGAGEAHTTGQENTFVGYDAGLNATTGIRNFYGGWNAKGGTDGSNNVMIGYRTGASLTAGNTTNVFIGSQSGDNASQKVDATNSIAIGEGTFTTANNQIILGNTSISQTRLRGAIYFDGSAGTSGQVLQSNGTGSAPTWTGTPTGITLPISSLTAATGTNTINNANFAQEWQWNSLSAQNGVFRISSNSTVITDGDKLMEVEFEGANASASRGSTALSVVNTKTGTTSTNVGASFVASGANNNYAVLVPSGSGSVGIGTSTPTQLLEVAANIKYTGQLISTKQTVTYGTTTTWNWNSGTNAEVTLTGNITTFTITNAVAGTYATIRMVQDGTGSRLLSALPANSKVFNGGAGAITLSTAANSIDLLTVYYDGTNYYWNYALNYN